MPLLKEKTSKLGSVFSFMAVSLLIVLFFLALPEFLLSTTGRMFVVLWAFVAICVFLAHGRRISMKRRRVRASLSTVHTKRTHSTAKTKRLLRG